jgi:hypothetical protein
MMSSSVVPHSPRAIVVELYENERRWIGRGFSKKGLLPTERGPYSTADGSLSFTTLDELAYGQQAQPLLLGRGWLWEEGSQFEYCYKYTKNTVGASSDDETAHQWDKDGWSYAVDFSPTRLLAATCKQGMAHFVRRRSIRRNKYFDPHEFSKIETQPPAAVCGCCQNVDSHALESLSLSMLQALAAASLLQRDEHSVLTDAVVLQQREKLVDYLKIGAPLPEWLQRVDASTRLVHVQRDLDKFAEQQKNVMAQAFGSGVTSKGLAERMELISSLFFGGQERHEIAAIVMRQLDRGEGELCCRRTDCCPGDHTCEFLQLECPNEGCERMISRKHLSSHADQQCDFKMINCPNGCGISFPRHQRDRHVTLSCGLRKGDCPFRAVGCEASVPHRELARHIEEKVIDHMLLAVKRTEEHQVVFCKMYKQLEHLERENMELKGVVLSNDVKHIKEIARVEKDLKAATRKVSDLERKFNQLSR